MNRQGMCRFLISKLSKTPRLYSRGFFSLGIPTPLRGSEPRPPTALLRPPRRAFGETGKAKQWGRRGKQGAVLIEVLLAITVLSVGLTFIIHAYLSSLKGTVYAEDYTTAIILLENEMSGLMQKGYIETGLDEENNFPAPYERFRYHLTTKGVLEGEGQPFLNEVVLRCSWASGRRKNNVAITTYLFNIPQ